MISGLESDPLPDPLEKEMATHSSISCLENPMDRGAWQATVYGVTRVGHDLATKLLLLLLFTEFICLLVHKLLSINNLILRFNGGLTQHHYISHI